MAPSAVAPAPSRQGEPVVPGSSSDAGKALPPVPAPGAAGSQPPERDGILKRLFRWLVRGLLVLILVLGLGIVWLGSETGLGFALGWAQRLLVRFDQALAFEQLEGNLWQGIRLGRFEWRGADMVVKGTDLRARWSLRTLMRGDVKIRLLGAETLVVQLPPAQDQPRTDTPMPGDLGLPLPLAIEQVDIGRFELWPADALVPAGNRASPAGAAGGKAPAAEAAAPAAPSLVLTGIQGRIQYDLEQYRIEALTLGSPWGQVSGGALHFDAAPPHRLKLDLDADGLGGPWAYALALSADGSLERLPLRLQGEVGGKGKADLQAVLHPLARIPLESLQARLADIDLHRLGGQAALPVTGIDLDLKLEPDSRHDSQWQGRILLKNRGAGRLSDQRLPLSRLESGLSVRLPVDNQWAKSFVRLRNLQLQLPIANPAQDDPARLRTVLRQEARIAGNIEILPGRPLRLPGLVVPAVMAELQLQELDLAPFAEALPGTALSGQLKLDGQQFLLDLSQKAAQVRSLLPDDLQSLASDARVRLAGRLDERLLKLEEVQAVLGRSSIQAEGQVSVNAPHELRLKGGLHQIDLAPWLPPDPGADGKPRQGMLGADWSVRGVLMGPGQKAQINLQLVDSSLLNQPLRGHLRADAALDAQWRPLSLKGVDISLAHGESGQLALRGALGQTRDRLETRLNLGRLALIDSRLAGALRLDGALKGPFDALSVDAVLQGNGLDLQMRDESGEIRHASLKKLRFRLDSYLNLPELARQDHPVELQLVAQQLGIGGEKVDGINLSLRGSASQHSLGLLVDEGADRLQLNATGELRQLKDGLQWHALLGLFDVSGRASIRLDNPVPLVVDAKGLDLGKMRMSVLGGGLHLDRLRLDWAGPFKYESDGRLEGLVALQVRDLFELGNGHQLAMLQHLRADASWQLRGVGAASLFGHAELGLREEVPPGEQPKLGLRTGNGLKIRVDGRALDGQARLDLPSIALANLFLGADLAVDGALSVDGSVRGTLDRPLLDLRLKGKDLQVLQRSAGLRLSGGELDARLGSDSLDLKVLRFVSGDGGLSLKGQARLVERPGQPLGETLASVDEIETARRKQQGSTAARQPSVLPMDGRFDVTLERFRVPIGPGQRITVSGSTWLSSSAKGLFLDGSLLVDDGLIEIQGSSAPSLPSDIQVINARELAEDTAAPDDDASILRIKSQLEVDLGSKLRVTGRGVDARLGGQLKVGGYLPDSPLLTGALRLVEGSYSAYGQNLKITKGLVRFNGPVDNPALDIEAKRPFLPVDVGISVTGQVANPQITLISRPSMPETSKLSWLVLGVPPDQAGGAAQMLALQQAGQLLLGDDGSHSPSIAERLGLDVFNYGYASDTDVDQGMQESLAPKGLLGRSGGDEASAEDGVVSVGKRINDRLFISYEKGVRGVWSLLRLQYTLGRGFVLRTQTGSDNSIDLLRSRTFD